MKKIKLTPQQFIAKGRDRACYRHPTQTNLCVKVAIKPEKQSLREKAYFNFLTKRNTDLRLISQYRGEVETNLGRGYLFDLAVNYNNQISETLKQTIKKNIISQQEVHCLLTTLKQYLEDNSICVKDLSPNNLAYVKENENSAYLFIIDGIGSPNHNPVYIFSKFLIKKALNKNWVRLNRKVNHLYDPQALAKYTKNKSHKTNKRLPFVIFLTVAIALLYLF